MQLYKPFFEIKTPIKQDNRTTRTCINIVFMKQFNCYTYTHSKEYPHGKLKGIAPTNKKVTWT